MAYNASNESLQLKRVNLLGLVFAALLVLIMGRIFQRQIIEHSSFLALAKDQHVVNEEVVAKRGKVLVYDQQLEAYYPLATNVSLYSLNVVPTQVTQSELVATKLLPFLSDITETALLEILQSNKVYVPPLKRRVEVKEKEAIEADQFLNRYGVIILIFLIFPFAGRSPVFAILTPIFNFILNILLPGSSVI